MPLEINGIHLAYRIWNFEPWHGYPLSAWTRENEDEAERAISGDILKLVKTRPETAKSGSRRLMITVGIVSPARWLDPGHFGLRAVPWSLLV